jgi:hypothetical protein
MILFAIVLVLLGIVSYTASKPWESNSQKKWRLVAFSFFLVGLAILAIDLFATHPRLLLIIVAASVVAYFWLPAVRKVAEQTVTRVSKEVGEVREEAKRRVDR